VPGGATGCQAVFDELTLREHGDYRYARFHNDVVDNYCLQHPDGYCASAKSLAAHLMGLCGALERGGDLEVRRAMQRWLNGPSPVAKPAVPDARGTVTILDVRAAEDPIAFAEAVRRWSLSTWEAYASLQPLARRWIFEATRGTR